MEVDPIQRLSDILADQKRWYEPWTSGTFNLSGVEPTLFFKRKDGSSRDIQLGSTSKTDVEDLVNACYPATFGRGQQSVHDEEYRKALKLDRRNFSWLFNPDSGDFMNKLAQGLCPWDTLNEGIRLEPLAINVYEKGGFFKAHRDTPGGKRMFGSLVFVLPIEHEGGNLVLRASGREHNFDASSLLRNAPATTVAYVAFYSDVEHEVLEVTSGNRVTITFNIYFDITRTFPCPPSRELMVPPNPFTTALRDQLRDASFVRAYRYLGFGLEYRYPGYAQDYNYDLLGYLKGPDAFLYRIFISLRLKPSIRYLYRSAYANCDFWVMRDHTIEGRYQNVSSIDTELDYLLEGEDAAIVWAKGKSEDATIGGRTAHQNQSWLRTYLADVQYHRSRTRQVHWITEPSDNLTGNSLSIEIANEPVHEIYYYGVCIIIDAEEVPLS